MTRPDSSGWLAGSGDRRPASNLKIHHAISISTWLPLSWAQREG